MPKQIYFYLYQSMDKLSRRINDDISSIFLEQDLTFDESFPHLTQFTWNIKSWFSDENI